MDAKRFETYLQDKERIGDDAEAAAAPLEARLKDVHTVLPGIVKSFDAAKQTAQVQPAIKRLFVETGFVELPVCVDCPVVFPSGGGFVLTFPVAAGDECLLMFSERAIDNWWDRGGTQEPSEYRLHDLSDGFALVGVSSRPRFISNVAQNAAELRSRDGSTVVRVENGKVKINAPSVELGGASAAVARKGDSIKLVMQPEEITNLIGAIYQTQYFLTNPNTQPAPPPPPPPGTVTFQVGEITSGNEDVKA